MVWSLIFALLSGALLPLAFSPFGIYSLAFLMPAVLLFLWLKSTPKEAFLIGLFFGLAFFGIGTSWIYISIHNYGNASAFLAGLITLMFIFIMALYPATLGYIFRKFFQNKSESIQCLLAFPALWVLWEWLRSMLMTGFPWLLLGYSQLDTPLKGLSPIIGVYGLSLVITVISGALVLLGLRQRLAIRILSLCLIFGFVGLGFVFKDHAWTKPTGKPIKASLIQGNIPQTMKWDAKYMLHNINVYKQLTFKHWNSALIVWPEGALPILAQDVPNFIRLLGRAAKKHQDTIMFGAPIQNNSGSKYYNALLLIGENKGQYLKRHLVPFGEYVPLKPIFGKAMKYFKIPMSGFSAGPKHQPLVRVNGVPIATFLCYEIAFPSEVLDSAEHSELLATLSDDSWFGRSIALTQHLQMAQMRSLETGRYGILSANTGITAFISPFGKIILGAPIDKRIVITNTVIPMTGKTPLMIWHYYPVYSFMGLMLLLALLL